MNTQINLVLLLLIFIRMASAQQSDNNFPSRNLLGLSNSYLGQTPPGIEPQVFAKNIVSLDYKHEYCIAFSPDGGEIYFNRAGEGIMVCFNNGSEWTNPQKAAFGEQYVGGEVHITYDGKHLLMNRFARLDSSEKAGIWSLQKKNNGWGEAQFLIPMGMRATST